MTKIQPLQAPKGMHDILPQDQPLWEMLRRAGEEIFRVYGFERIDLPVVEATELFVRGVGAATEVVEKQMFNFRTRGGDLLSLRPELTASVMRAYIEHGLHTLPQPVKVWYRGPVFRHETPQSGRYRQHWQMGIEIVGEAESVLDVEIMQALYAIFFQCNLADVLIHVNSIGDKICRPVYRKSLLAYYRARRARLCKECKQRLRFNPLRLLDCKVQECQALRSGAPQLFDSLCDDCHKHFRGVLEFLDEADLPYILDPYLVRGLDYYTRTVFEFFPEDAQEHGYGALGGGGRYDALSETVGGRPTPATGGVIGLDRTVDVLRRRAVLPKPSEAERPRIFLAQLGGLGKKKSLKLFEDLRRAGLSAAQSFSKDSLKVQLRIANRLGVTWVLILGEKEALDGIVILREMSSGIQETIRIENVIEELRKRI